MKNTFKNGLLLVAVAASAVVGWSFFGPPPPSPAPTLSTYTDTDGSVRFVVHDLPYVVANSATQTQRYSIMLNPGDGTAFTEIVTLPLTVNGSVANDTLSHKHFYAQTQAYKSYTEMTALDYTDTGEPPKSMRAAHSVTPTVASTADYTITLNGWAKIEATRKVVKGDSITYIVTYQNPENGCESEVHGDIFCKYDTTKLKYIRTDKYFSETSFQHTFPGGSVGELKWTYLHLQPKEQRNIFLVFFAKNTVAVRDTLNPTPTLVFTHGNDVGSIGSPCSNASTSSVHTGSNTVSYSHDPNDKTANLQTICKTDEYITYTVRFQNEGHAPARQVVINDDLPNIFRGAAPEFITSSHESGRAPAYTAAERIAVTFDTFGIREFLLRGTHEPGYGTKFGESATMGYVTFRVKLPKFTPVLYCQSIPNRAKITFDCNPPIWTAPEITPYSCTDTCVACKQLPNITQVGFAALPDSEFNWASNSELAGLIKNLADKGFSFRWYPNIGMDLNDVPQPDIARTQPAYTVIASRPSGCESVVIHVPINFSSCASMKIKVDSAGLQASNCSGGYIRAWVEGGMPPFRWMDCKPARQRTDTLKMDTLAPGTYYLGVTDRNQCTAEAWVEIKAPSSPLHVDDDPRDCTAKLRITGGTPPYNVQWNATRNSNPESSTSTTFDLAQTTSASVTVTDSKGCSVVFAPKSAGCQGYDEGPGGGSLIWILLSLILAGAGLGFLWQRNRKKQ